MRVLKSETHQLNDAELRGDLRIAACMLSFVSLKLSEYLFPKIFCSPFCPEFIVFFSIVAFYLAAAYNNTKHQITAAPQRFVQEHRFVQITQPQTFVKMNGLVR